MHVRDALESFLPPPGSGGDDALRAEIRAELEHHLARSAEDLTAQGLSPVEARAEALRRFGDPERVEQDCLRIRTGGSIMLRRVHAVTTVLLFLAVLFLVWDTRIARARAMEAAQMARQEALQARALLEEQQREETEPVEHIVIKVGDRLTLMNFSKGGGLLREDSVEADGKFLLPTGEWIHVAGLTREEVERVFSEAMKDGDIEYEIRVKVRSP